MSNPIKSAFWAVRYGLTYSDAGQLDDVLNSLTARTITFRTGEKLVTCRRLHEGPIRGQVREDNKIYAISKDSLNLVQSPLLKTVLKIILGYNRIHGGRNVSSNAKAWRKNYDQ